MLYKCDHQLLFVNCFYKNNKNIKIVIFILVDSVKMYEPGQSVKALKYSGDKEKFILLWGKMGS